MDEQRLAALVEESVKKALAEHNIPCCQQTSKKFHCVMEDVGVGTLYYMRDFMKGVQSGRKVVVRTSIGAVVVGVLYFLGDAIWCRVADLLKLKGV